MFKYFVKKQRNDALCFAKTGLILLVDLFVLLVDCILQKQSYKLNTTPTSVVSRSIPHQVIIRIFVVWMVLGFPLNPVLTAVLGERSIA